jgi:hypothetical protein
MAQETTVNQPTADTVTAVAEPVALLSALPVDTSINPVDSSLAAVGTAETDGPYAAIVPADSATTGVADSTSSYAVTGSAPPTNGDGSTVATDAAVGASAPVSAVAATAAPVQPVVATSAAIAPVSSNLTAVVDAEPSSAVTATTANLGVNQAAQPDGSNNVANSAPQINSDGSILAADPVVSTSAPASAIATAAPVQPAVVTSAAITPISGDPTVTAQADLVGTVTAAPVDLGTGQTAIQPISTTIATSSAPYTVISTMPAAPPLQPLGISGVTTNPNGTLTVSGAATPGSTVAATFPNGAIATAIVSANGSYSVTSHAAVRLQPGQYSVLVTNTDAAGHSNAGYGYFNTGMAYVPSQPFITVITENPDGSITVAGTAHGNSVVVTFPDGSVMNASLTDTSFPTSFLMTSAPAQPNGVVSLESVPAAGSLYGAGSYAVNYVQPLHGPATISAIVQDTGSSSTDFITNDNTLAIRGSYSGMVAGQRAASTQISLDGGQTWHQVTLGPTTMNMYGGGSWTYSTGVLPDGNYSVAVRELDSAGHQLGAVTVQQVVVDTTAPAETVTIAHTSSDGETLSGTLSSALANGSQPGVSAEQLQISLNHGITWQNVTVAAGSTAWSYQSGTPLANGASIQARIVDTAGNHGPTTVQTVMTTVGGGDAIQITGITRDTGSSPTDFITNDNTLVINGTLSQPLVNPPAGVVGGTYQAVRVSLDGGQTWHDAAVNGTTWTYNNTANPLPDGTYTVEAQIYQWRPVYPPVTSVLGEATQQVVVDTTPPQAPGVSTLAVNPDGTLTVAGIAGMAEPSSTVAVTFHDGSTSTAIAGSDGSYSITSSKPEPFGVVSVTATDVAGNTSASGVLPLGLDRPVQNPDGTLTVTGTANPGDTVIATFPNGSMATGKVDASGHYSITSIDMQASGNVSVTDTNTSGSVTQTWVWAATTPPPLDGAVTWSSSGSGSVIFGMTEPGSTVTATFPNGRIAIGTAGSNGVFSFTSSTSVMPRDVITLTATNVGGTSQPETVMVGYAMGVLPPPNPDGSYTLTSGTNAPPYSTVTLILPNGTTYGTTADANGSYTINSSTPMIGPWVTVFTGGHPLVVNPLSIDAPVQNPDGTLTVTGKAHPGDMVSATFPDGSTATSMVDANGHYSITSHGVQTSGSVTVLDADAAGHTVTQTLVWTDTTPPQAPTVYFLDTTGGVGLWPDGGMLSITGHAEAGSTVTVVFADGSRATGVAGSDGSYTVISHSVQAAGIETITATDAAGNTSQPASVYWNGVWATMDTSVQNGNGTLTMAGYAPVGDTVTITFGDGSSVTSMVGSGSRYSLTSATVQTTGTETVVITDSAGHTTTLTYPWTDTTPPLAPTVTLSAPDAHGDLTVTGTAEPGSTVTVTFPDHSTATSMAGVNGSYSITSSAPQPSGDISVTATDAAGNVSAATTVHSTGPAQGGIQITSITPDTGASASDFITNDNTLVIHGTLSQPLVNPPVGVVGGTYQGVRVSLDGGHTWDDATVSGTTWTYDATANALPDGAYTVEAQIYQSRPLYPPPPVAVIGEATQQVVVDTVAPVEAMTITSATLTTIGPPPGGPEQVTPDYIMQGVKVTGTLGSALANGSQPGVSAESVQVSLDGGHTWNDATVSGTTWSYTAGLLAGTTAVEARVIDLAGNAGPVATHQITAGGGTPVPTETVNFVGMTPDTGVQGDWITNDSSTGGKVTLTLHTSAPLQPGEVVQVGYTDLNIYAQTAQTLATGSIPSGNHGNGSSGWLTAQQDPSDPSGQTWTISLPLFDGLNGVTAGVVNASGVFGPVTATQNITIANTPPSIMVTNASDNSAGLLTIAGFTGGSNAGLGGSTVTVVYADGTSATGITDASGNFSVTSHSAQAAGTETITVTDVAGNTSPLSTVKWTGTNTTIDTISQNSDGTLTVAGSAPAGDKINVIFSGGSFNGTGIADSTGHYSITSTTVQTTGPVEVTASGGGVISSVTQTWIDTTPPVAPTVSSTSENSAGLLTITGTAEAGSKVAVTFPDGSISMVTTGSDGHYSVTSNAPEPAGPMSVTATDAAGNVSAATTINFPGPSNGLIHITGITPDTGASASDFITNDNTLVIHGTLSQPLPPVSYIPGSGVEGVRVSLDGGQTWHYATVSGTTWTCDVTANALPDGAYTVEAQIYQSQPLYPPPPVTVIGEATQQVVVDTTPPAETVTMTSMFNGNTDVNGSTISGTLSSALADGHQPGVSAEQLQISLDNGATWQDVTVAPGSTAWTYHSSSSAWPVYTENLQARVVDAAGNTGEPVKFPELVATGTAGDTSASSTDPSPINPPELPISPGVYFDPNDTVTVSGTAEPGSAVAVTFADGSTAAGTAGADGAYSVTSSTPESTSGSTLITAINAAGNTSHTYAITTESSSNVTLSLSLSDVLSEVRPASTGATQQITINTSGGGVPTVDLTDGVGAGANQWRDTGTTTVNGVLYDVYHNASQGANTVADLLIQHGIQVI